MSCRKIIVAIDGYSSSGKSTMARELARKVGYAYIDSGAMYRAATLFAINNGLLNADGSLNAPALIARLPEIGIDFRVAPDGSSHTFLNGEDVEGRIRQMDVASLVSPVAAVPEVRERLTAMMQGYGKGRGIVMDGRDIGTTVFPDAELKVFVDASPEVRAQRRYRELIEKEGSADYDEVLRNICQRDHIDRTRATSPLRKADDALTLDNDAMTREEQMQWLLSRFNEACSR